MIWVWVIVFLVMVGVWISLRHLHIHMFFSRVKDNDHFFIHLKMLGGLISYRLDIPVIEYQGLYGGFLVKAKTFMRMRKEEMQHKQKQQYTPERISDIYQWGKELLSHVKEFTDWLHHTLMHVKCSEFRWNTRLGIGDAAETALATGVLWAVKSTMFGYIFQYVHLETKPKLTIQPQYNKLEFSTEFSCRAKIRIGFIFYSLLLLVWRIIRTKRGLLSWKKIIFRKKDYA